MLATSTVMLDQRTSTITAAGSTATRRNSFSSFVRTLLLMVSPPSKNAPHCRGIESEYDPSSLGHGPEQCVEYKNSLFLEMYYSFPALDETENDASSPIVHCAADHLLPSLAPKPVVC